MNFADMPSTHFIFIPAVLIIGVVIVAAVFLDRLRQARLS